MDKKIIRNLLYGLVALFTLLLNGILTAIYILLPEILLLMISKIWILLSVFGLSGLFLFLGYYRANKQKLRSPYRLFWLITGNNFLGVSIYCLIGRLLTQ